MNMKEQLEEAKTIIDDIITMHIHNLRVFDGECEDEAEIKAALKLLYKLAEKSVK